MKLVVYPLSSASSGAEFCNDARCRLNRTRPRGELHDLQCRVWFWMLVQGQSLCTVQKDSIWFSRHAHLKFADRWLCQALGCRIYFPGAINVSMRMRKRQRSLRIWKSFLELTFTCCYYRVCCYFLQSPLRSMVSGLFENTHLIPESPANQISVRSSGKYFKEWGSDVKQIPSPAWTGNSRTFHRRRSRKHYPRRGMGGPILRHRIGSFDRRLCGE